MGLLSESEGPKRVKIGVYDTDIEGNKTGLAYGETGDDVVELRRPGFLTEKYSPAITSKATDAEAATRTVGANELGSTHLTNWLNKDSVFSQRARQHGLMTANRRGLLNTSLAAGASMGAVMDRLQPFALDEARGYRDAAQANQNARQQAALQNAQLRTQVDQANASNQLQGAIANQNTAMDMYSAELGSVLDTNRMYLEEHEGAKRRQLESGLARLDAGAGIYRAGLVAAAEAINGADSPEEGNSASRRVLDFTVEAVNWSADYQQEGSNTAVLGGGQTRVVGGGGGGTTGGGTDGNLAEGGGEPGDGDTEGRGENPATGGGTPPTTGGGTPPTTGGGTPPTTGGGTPPTTGGGTPPATGGGDQPAETPEQRETRIIQSPNADTSSYDLAGLGDPPPPERYNEFAMRALDRFAKRYEYIDGLETKPPNYDEVVSFWTEPQRTGESRRDEMFRLAEDPAIATDTRKANRLKYLAELTNSHLLAWRGY